jgi:hypothetical protein
MATNVEGEVAGIVPGILPLPAIEDFGLKSKNRRFLTTNGGPAAAVLLTRCYV